MYSPWKLRWLKFVCLSFPENLWLRSSYLDFILWNLFLNSNLKRPGFGRLKVMREKSTHSVKLELLFAILLKYLYVGSGRVFRKFSDINSMRARMPGLCCQHGRCVCFPCLSERQATKQAWRPVCASWE